MNLGLPSVQSLENIYSCQATRKKNQQDWIGSEGTSVHLYCQPEAYRSHKIRPPKGMTQVKKTKTIDIFKHNLSSFYLLPSLGTFWFLKTPFSLHRAQKLNFLSMKFKILKPYHDSSGYGYKKYSGYYKNPEEMRELATW